MHLKLGHIQSYEGFSITAIPVQVARYLLCQFSLPNARAAQKQENQWVLPIRPPILLSPDGRGNGGNGTLLANDELFQPLFQREPPPLLLLLQLLPLFHFLCILLQQLLSLGIIGIVKRRVTIVICPKWISASFQ